MLTKKQDPTGSRSPEMVPNRRLNEKTVFNAGSQSCA